ncbi:sodium transporter [Mesoplasma florum]|nr:potassium transporter TrkG [Mesoplasma florum]ATI73809.1 sodium transporter [Mesoplasma florum]AVN59467.1 sodium transporter [Mesoplasma florum]AVN60847.1 sodium transporter [Mesoplasma florum]AVN64910.1 sodium transporter [Mesoplasma florum]
MNGGNQMSTNTNKSNKSKWLHFKKNKEQKNKFDPHKAFLKLKTWWPLSKVSGRIFLIYLFIVLFGGFLLCIPGIVVNNDLNGYDFRWDYLTGIFTASSAFSDTGINIIDPSHDYTFWGQLILLILIEMGGIGVLTLKIILFISINKKISLSDTVVAQSERGNDVKSSTIELIKDGFIFLTFIQLIAAGVLFFLFFFSEPATQSLNGTELNVVSPYHNFIKSIWFAIFHSTSAINNAGYDLLSTNSLQPYNIEGHQAYAIQIVFLLEWVIGGLGYPTFHDIKRKMRARRVGQKVKFSLFTKLNFWVYSTLFVVGPLLIFLSEYSNQTNSLIFNYYTYDVDPLTQMPINVIVTEAKPTFAVAMDIIFNTTACRNAGFSTVPINDFNASSKTILSSLMFIGSAPSSTAGGIRTTTFAIILLSTWAIIRNKSYTSAFKKVIPAETVRRSFSVFFISVFILTIVIILIYFDSNGFLTPGIENGVAGELVQNQGDASIVQILTLITSAYGTVGMNPFTQHQMYNFGVLTKLLIILCMFLGQLGISNTLLAFIKPSRKTNFKYLEEDVTIG